MDMAATDLLELGALTDPTYPPRRGLLPDRRPTGYLEMLNLFRVVACLAVLGQHSFIWTNMTGTFVGTGFITMLHLSRTSFFFLTALVVTYAQIDHPRSTGEFWRRRYTQVGVPYLAWTGIYLIFSLITIHASWDEVGVFLRHNVLLGYSQMYFVIVIFEFYLFFPLLMKLLRAVNHAWVMAGSLAFATLIGLFLHYPSWFSPLSGANQTINHTLPWGRNILVYQEFLIAGMLVAFHLDEVFAFVSRHYRRIIVGSGAVGVLMVLWYMISVWAGSSVERASDIYEPQAALWCLAAIAGIFSLSWWWHDRTVESRRHGSGRALRSTAYLAGLTGGVFFAHTLFITMIRSELIRTGLRANLPWEATVAILFVGTVSLTGAFIAVVLRTPLRWVLGGPVRAEERASYVRRDALRPAAEVLLSDGGRSDPERPGR
jgi:membrane-bound acyltransferase YfiQ involved in biofilm formation